MKIEEHIADNITRVQDRIAAACARAGRPQEGVRLIAVSKKQSPDKVAAAAACGQRIFGENKVQEAQAKIPLCPDMLSWHLIGHLQTNKAQLAARLFDVVHSVDSLRLMDKLNQAAGDAGKNLAVMLQVNVGGESSKFGISPEALPMLLEKAGSFLHLDLVGLMTLPPFHPDPEQVRPYFARLRELRDEWAGRSGIPLEELSMGMSHDLEMAIAEGATYVRVGTDVFGERKL